MQSGRDGGLRRSIRLPAYDYSSPGAYFVTVCCQDRNCRFGEVVQGEMRLNDVGRMIQTQWEALDNRFPSISLDAFVVMPNHVHGVILIDSLDDRPSGDGTSAPVLFHRSTEAPQPRSQPPSLGAVIGTFKSITTHEYILGVRQDRWPAFHQRFWQRNYYEHVVRNEGDLNQIREYIATNPLRWELDPENPQWTNGGGSKRSTTTEI